MSPDLETGTTVGSFQVESVLGRGGMGVVYLAQDLRLGRRVALKVLSPDLANDDRFRERFTRESRMAASIDHPNIIPVYEAGDSDGMLYLAMRYVDGTDLRDTLLQGGPLTVERTLAILRQVAAALDSAHTHGLVHRDVKPGNIMIASGIGTETPDHVYLTDFGLTKRTQAETQLTAVGQFVGTIDYAAPEQITGRPMDGRTDQYSLGCVLYECLTGIVPFRRDSDVEVLFAHMSEPPPTLSSVRPDLPAGFDDALTRAMAKERADRFATCSEFVAACRAAGGGEARAAPPVAPPAPTLVGAPAAPAAPPQPPAPQPSPAPEPETVAVGTGEPITPAPQAPVGPPVTPAQPGAAAAEARRPEPTTPGRRQASSGSIGALALIGAAGVLAAALSSLTVGWPSVTFWNSWAVLSPLEAIGVAAAVAWVAIAALRSGISRPFAAGTMLGFGVVAFVGCLALLLFGNRVEATNSLSFVALAAIAVVVGGVMGLRGGAGASPAPRRVDPTALALAIGGIALCVIAFFVDYDGQSSLISELSEAKDFLLDPAAAVIAMAIGVVFLAGTRNRALAAGLLLAAGVEAALHFPGLIIASSKAIGEPGNVGAAGFVGAIGGILVAVGGLVSLRSSRRWSPG